MVKIFSVKPVVAAEKLFEKQKGLIASMLSEEVFDHQTFQILASALVPSVNLTIPVVITDREAGGGGSRGSAQLAIENALAFEQYKKVVVL